jgi:hypothetical protein
MTEVKTIPVIIVEEDGDNPDGTTVWGIDQIKSFGQYLIDNIDPDTKMEVTFTNFSQKEWDRSIALGKSFSGEELTKEEALLLED